MDIKNLKRGQRVLVRAGEPLFIEGAAIVHGVYPDASAVKVEMCDDEDRLPGSIVVRASEVIKELPL